MPVSRTASRQHPVPNAADAVVRWAAFSCGLVPVILVCCGISFPAAISATLGLAAVTGTCRLLLLQSERGAARLRAAERAARYRGRQGGAAARAHGSGRRNERSTPRT
ncbi:hypothetical protein NGF19_00745 [Streptomyces sp. RY43-2]|uniref:Uncharacterized protein n=1 Tax=Streptomyces macrolidinus TaxID=2952607 RepID=A0ABT0Z924_9ACTN|nr:hypothetical protein [Streptomyces macrolidinus]MCN9239326.1 hypothetical protein [Streptomyces macrolidinus]